MNESVMPGHSGGKVVAESIVPRLLVFFAITLLTYSILSNTLTIPFFVIDDSDVLNKAIGYQEAVFDGDVLKLFDRDISGSRYWPGFTLYLVLRTWLFGTSSILWHLWQVTLYAIAGICLVYLGKRISGSYLPGGFAHVLLLATGTADYQSNWFNYIFTNSFEPLIYLLWVAAALLFIVAWDAGSRWKRRLLSACGAVLLIWSVTAKETTAPALLLFVVPIALLWARLRKRRSGLPIPRHVLAALIVTMAFAFGWLVVLLFMIRHGAGYAATGTLVMNPVDWLRALADYGGFWIESTHLLFPAAFLHYIARVAARRHLTLSDGFQGILFWAALCQVLTLVIWPEKSMRLSQPGYALALLAACIEWHRFLSVMQNNRPGHAQSVPFLVRIAGSASLLFMLSGKAFLGLQTFSVCLRLLFYAWGIAIIALLYLSYRREGPARYLRALSLLYACWIGVVLIHLIAVNLSSYMATYEIREGLRRRMAAYISRAAPRGARVTWLVPPDGDIFAWSAGIHSRLFFDRGDLTQGPHSFIRNAGPLRKGDLIVAYGLPTSRSPEGKGSLLRKTIDAGGVQAPAQSLQQLEKLIIDLVIPPFRLPRERDELKELKAQTAIYSVQSETWVFDPEFEKRFLPTAGGD